MLNKIPFLGLYIPSYAFMVLIGLICFTVCTIKIMEKIERYNEKVTNRLLIVSAVGFVSLVFFAFVFNSIFHSIRNGRITIGGITWLGGVLGSFPFMIFLIRKFCPVLREKPLESFNFLMPGIVIAHCFGRIGCFLGGCCYGSVTDSIFGVSFPKGSTASIDYPGPDGNSLPVHPTQLYEAIFGLILFIIMISLYKKLKKYFLELYLFSYGIFRFLLEFLRGDNRGATGFFISPSQLMSIILIIGGILIVLYKKKIIFKNLFDNSKFNSAEDEANKNAKIIDELVSLKNLYENNAIDGVDFIKRKELLLKNLCNADSNDSYSVESISET